MREFDLFLLRTGIAQSDISLIRTDTSRRKPTLIQRFRVFVVAELVSIKVDFVLSG